MLENILIGRHIDAADAVELAVHIRKDFFQRRIIIIQCQLFHVLVHQTVQDLLVPGCLVERLGHRLKVNIPVGDFNVEHLMVADLVVAQPEIVRVHKQPLRFLVEQASDNDVPAVLPLHKVTIRIDHIVAIPGLYILAELPHRLRLVLLQDLAGRFQRRGVLQSKVPAADGVSASSYPNFFRYSCIAASILAFRSSGVSFSISCRRCICASVRLAIDPSSSSTKYRFSGLLILGRSFLRFLQFTMLHEILQPLVNVALGRFNHAVCNIHLPHLLRLKGPLLLRCGLCVLRGAFLCLGLDLRLKAVSGAPVVLHQVFLFDNALRDLYAGQFIEHLLRQLRAHVEFPEFRVAHALAEDQFVHDLGAVFRVPDANAIFCKNSLIVAQRFAGRGLRRFHLCFRLLRGFPVRLDLAFQGFHKLLARQLRADVILPDHCRRHLEALRLRPHLKGLV